MSMHRRLSEPVAQPFAYGPEAQQGRLKKIPICRKGNYKHRAEGTGHETLAGYDDFH